ncbi:MAG: glycosyltransferase family 39 protein [Spirochaetota bacterium]
MKSFYTRHPLLVILAAALALRTAAAFYNYTPTAEDDYANIIEPALKHYQTGEQISTELYRLPILPKVFFAFLAPLKIGGVTDTTLLVSWGLFCLGLISLAGVWAFYQLVRQVMPGREKAAGWLYAGHFLLPFFSTRAFQESLTLTTVPLALYFLYHPARPPARLFLAGLFIGLTVIFRFQAAILAVTLFAYLCYEVLRRKTSVRQLIAFVCGGLGALLLLVGLDLAEGRAALSTPLEYVRINFIGNVVSQSYGAAPWHTYLTLLTVVFIPPFSFILLVPFFRAMRSDMLSTICLTVFLVLHSMIGNKLERFMLPIVPFFFLLTLRGLWQSESSRPIKFAWRGFIVLNLLILVPITLSRSQLNTIHAAQYLANSARPLLLYRIDLWKQAYMTFAKPVPASYADAAGLAAGLKSTAAPEADLLSLGTIPAETQKEITDAGYQCSPATTFEPSWQEKIVIYLNPRFNARRDTSVLYRCVRQVSAPR